MHINIDIGVGPSMLEIHGWSHSFARPTDFEKARVEIWTPVRRYGRTSTIMSAVAGQKRMPIDLSSTCTHGRVHLRAQIVCSARISFDSEELPVPFRCLISFFFVIAIYPRAVPSLRGNNGKGCSSCWLQRWTYLFCRLSMMSGDLQNRGCE